MFSSHWCLKNVVWNVCLKYTANIDVLDREMCCAKKVETSVSSNKITVFCNNENNKQEVESLHSYSTDNNYSITEKTKVFVEAIKWDEKEGLRQ